MLASHYGYSVIGVETREELVTKVNEQNRNQPTFRMITYNITKEMQAKELEALLFSSSSTDHLSKREPVEPCYGFIGLHCCGDLSASMCRLFAESGPRCKVLCFVGCCYNLLTTKEDATSTPYGYPMNDDVPHIVMSHYCRNAIVQVCATAKGDV